MEFNGTDKGYVVGTVRNSAKECREEPEGNLLGPNENGKGTIPRSAEGSSKPSFLPSEAEGSSRPPPLPPPERTMDREPHHEVLPQG